jgi:hypothetical protein
MLEDEIREATKQTGKDYEDITRYYLLCKKRLGYYDYCEPKYERIRENIKEQAIAYTRDYIWFDERTIK